MQGCLCIQQRMSAEAVIKKPVKEKRKPKGPSFNDLNIYDSKYYHS